MILNTFDWLCLGVASFCAGFIDASVGGGGLIQLPAFIQILPFTTSAQQVSTVKLSAFFGTCLAAIRYSRIVNFNKKTVFMCCTFGMIGSVIGAIAVSIVPSKIIRSVLPIVLSFILLYTYMNKNFGKLHAPKFSSKTIIIITCIFTIIIGFYDGFLGPGSGSLLLFSSIYFLGFDFLHASAFSKIVNTATNISALILFYEKKEILFSIGIFMGIINLFGSFLGTTIVIKKQIAFIRYAFLVVVLLLILRLIILEWFI